MLFIKAVIFIFVAEHQNDSKIKSYHSLWVRIIRILLDIRSVCFTVPHRGDWRKFC
uniref:Uncharacterized protein n=1 Tax=Rhizophora mucronata TaxID=61149 RepID=A0A2P2Q923_RHIMU